MSGCASATGTALIDFSPAFMISVASMAFSFAGSEAGASWSFNAVPREAGREAGRVVFAFVAVVIRPLALAVLFSAAPSFSSSFATLSNNSSLSVATVADEHVVVDAMALFTDSIFAP